MNIILYLAAAALTSLAINMISKKVANYRKNKPLKVGYVWRGRNSSPFSSRNDVTILQVREGWVQFRWRETQSVQAMKVDNFHAEFTPRLS